MKKTTLIHKKGSEPKTLTTFAKKSKSAWQQVQAFVTPVVNCTFKFLLMSGQHVALSGFQPHHHVPLPVSALGNAKSSRCAAL